MSAATLFVTFQQPGFHSWSRAPESRSYLSHRHRHVFHVRVELTVPVSGERLSEFHDLLDRSKTVLRDIARRGTMYDFGDWSCEQIADIMAQRLANVYASHVSVTISEDGECGATVFHNIQSPLRSNDI